MRCDKCGETKERLEMIYDSGFEEYFWLCQKCLEKNKEKEED